LPEAIVTTTTDPQDELFDILDAEGNPTGMVKPRGLVHRDGDWHRGLHVWVHGFTDEGEPFVLFQRRSMSKDTWPGKLDVAVGGHYRAGESLEETLRETEEEIGLVAVTSDLVLLGTRFIDDVGNGYIDRELDDVFALRCDQPLTNYVMHPDEVDALVAIGVNDVYDLFHERTSLVAARQIWRETSHDCTVMVGLDDFAGDRPGYRQVVADNMLSLALGNQPVPFVLRE
jgi:isopentenyldiphosphate isomerase